MAPSAPAGLPRLFERSPKAALEIRPVDPLQRDTASSYYVPPAVDGSRRAAAAKA